MNEPEALPCALCGAVPDLTVDPPYCLPTCQCYPHLLVNGRPTLWHWNAVQQLTKSEL